MPDLHAWITQQIDHTEAVAHDAGGQAWHWEHGHGDMCNDPTCPYGELATDDTVLMDVHGFDITEPWQGAEHIALHDPAAVLRRCEADRRILTIHKPLAATWSAYYACEGCGYDGADYCSEPNVAHVNDCPTLLALAEGYGLTEEQRAQLDRPEAEQPKRKPGFGGMPDAIVEQMVRVSLARVPATFRKPGPA
jgi:hypothetical protein